MFTILETKELIDAGAMAGNLTSLTINALTVVSFTIASEVSSAAGLTGNLILEAQFEAGGSYKTYQAAIAITGDGVTIHEVLDPSALSYRIQWNNTGGTGSLDVDVSARVHKRGNAPDVEVL